MLLGASFVELNFFNRLFLAPTVGIESEESLARALGAGSGSGSGGEESLTVNQIVSGLSLLLLNSHLAPTTRQSARQSNDDSRFLADQKV